VAEKDFSFNDTISAEHKIGVPSKLELARDIAAFANAEGGHIFIGHIPTEEGLHSFTGLTDSQIQEAKESVEEALRFLHPKPLIDIVEDTTLGKSYQFIVINVQK
jgi:predicted HTH transcriptional regulator